MIKYSITEHAVAFPSKVLAQNGGSHIINIELTSDTDNGNFVAKGDYLHLDTYQEAAASTFTGVIREQAQNGNWYVECTANPDHELFVYMDPFIAEDFTNKFKAEKNFYNAKGETVRAYDLCYGDIVEVSDLGFTGTPAAGKTVTVADKKLVVA